MTADGDLVEHLRRLEAKLVSGDQFEALRIFIDRVDGFPFPQPKGPGLLQNYLAGQKGITVQWGSYFWPS